MTYMNKESNPTVGLVKYYSHKNILKNIKIKNFIPDVNESLPIYIYNCAPNSERITMKVGWPIKDFFKKIKKIK